MPQILTTNAMIMCPHGGVGMSSPSNPKWFVEGGAVLLDGDSGSITKAPCIFPLPCLGYQLRSMGLNATQVDGRKVMLVTDFTQSLTGFPLILTESHQAFDNSTPTPLSPGAAVPATPPELQEFDLPVVSVTPATLTFNKTGFSNSGNPVSLSMTFSLQTQFPRLWLLTMLNIPSLQHTEITDGNPPDIVVSPPGGEWLTPTLTVTVELLGSFLATLPIGDHYFVLTAVNFRGKSTFAEVKLIISA